LKTVEMDEILLKSHWTLLASHSEKATTYSGMTRFALRML